MNVLTPEQAEGMLRKVIAFFLDNYARAFYPHMREETASFRKHILTNKEKSIFSHPQLTLTYHKGEGDEEIVSLFKCGIDFYNLIRLDKETGVKTCVHEDDGTGKMKPILFWASFTHEVDVEIEDLFQYCKSKAIIAN